MTLGATVTYANRTWRVYAILRATGELWLRPVGGGHTERVRMEDVT